MSKHRPGLVHFKQIYNPKDVYGQGRLVALLDSLITGVYNVFITGIFYTGFLSMYGISITGVGIVTFIPYLANCFSIFSADVLSHFKRRKAALLGAKVLFYALYIIATTVMPQFVIEPRARLNWLIAILFVAHAVYALFSPGFTSWYYHFFPEDNQERTQYFMYNQFITSVLAHVVLLGSSVLADAVSASAYQEQLILGFRYLAFALVLADVAVQALAREFDESGQERVKIKDVLTLPLGHRRFLCCMGLMFFWNLHANLSNGLWSYHLLNHMRFSYLLINVMASLYVVIFAATVPLWRRSVDRYSWIRTFGIANLFWTVTEFAFFCMTPERGWMYVPLMLIQQVLNVGLNLSYANVLYMNLPKENATSFIAFQTIGCNIFAFLGLMIGTWISSLNNGQTVFMLGMEVYPLLFTCLLRGVNALVIGLVCIKGWRLFSSPSEIERVDDIARAGRRYVAGSAAGRPETIQRGTEGDASACARRRSIPPWRS